MPCRSSIASPKRPDHRSGVDAKGVEPTDHDGLLDLLIEFEPSHADRRAHIQLSAMVDDRLTRRDCLTIARLRACLWVDVDRHLLDGAGLDVLNQRVFPKILDLRDQYRVR